MLALEPSTFIPLLEYFSSKVTVKVRLSSTIKSNILVFLSLSSTYTPLSSFFFPAKSTLPSVAVAESTTRNSSRKCCPMKYLPSAIEGDLNVSLYPFCAAAVGIEASINSDNMLKNTFLFIFVFIFC